MTSLHLWLPALLTLAAARTHETSTQHPLVTPHNASEIVLACGPAENFIQTHMAPDFESPQLVRRLDWFHDDTLVASYQQVSGVLCSVAILDFHCHCYLFNCLIDVILSPILGS
ncbi:hypothetical protein Aduo_010750 [Ancylostoma duodenale]